MLIRLDTPIAKITTDLPEEQVVGLLQVVLDVATKGIPEIPHITPPKFPDEDIVVPTGVLPKKSKEINDVVKEALDNSDSHTIHLNGVPLTPATSTTYKGFLYLQCEECRKFKGFMPKSPISEYYCDCGHITHLKDVRVMRVNCKCGAKFKYLTNTRDNIVSMDCHTCGSPVDLEYHERKQEYVTIGS